MITGQPKHASVGVGVIILKNEKILLIKRTGSHGAGTWPCPGGHIDFGESLEETAIRETKEEVGITIDQVKFRAITNDIFADEHKHYVTVWMEANYGSGNPSTNSKRELTQVDWFDLDNLPEPLFIPLKNLLAGKSYPPDQLNKNIPMPN